MKKFLFSLLVGLLSLPAVHAVTINDLDGILVGHVFHGNFPQNALGVDQNCGKFVVEGNNLYIENFYNDYKLPVTLSNNCLVIKNNTRAVSATNSNNYILIKKAWMSLSAGGFYCPGLGDSRYTATGYGYNTESGDLTSDPMTEDATSSVAFWFKFPVATSSGSNSTGDKNCFILEEHRNGKKTESIYHGIRMLCQPPNAKAITTLEDGSTMSYPMRVELNGSQITVFNFLNLGPAYENYSDGSSYTVKIQDVDGTISGSTVNLGQPYIGGFCEFEYDFGWTSVSKQNIYSPSSGYTFSRWKPTSGTSSNYAYWVTDENYMYWDYTLQTASKRDVTGILSDGEADHVMGNKNTYWVSNGGDLTTQIPTKIIIGEANVVPYSWEGGYVLNSILSSTRSEISVFNDRDITHQVDMQLSEVGANETEGGFYLQCDITPTANHNNVKGYQIFAIPGKFTSINGLSTHDVTGIAGAKDITAYETDWYPGKETDKPANRASREIENPVTVTEGNVTYIPVSELNQATSVKIHLTPEQAKAAGIPLTTGSDYSAFVKTLYKDATGLEPTFHALATRPATTGVEDIVGTDEIPAVITVDNAAIIITGSEAPAEVYTVQGQLVYSGTDRTIALGRGVYIVRCGSTIAKVAL